MPDWTKKDVEKFVKRLVQETSLSEKDVRNRLYGRGKLLGTPKSPEIRGFGKFVERRFQPVFKETLLREVRAQKKAQDRFHFLTTRKQSEILRGAPEAEPPRQSQRSQQAPLRTLRAAAPPVRKPPPASIVKPARPIK